MLDEPIMANLKATLENVDGFSDSTVRRYTQRELSYNTVPCIDLVSGGSHLSKVVNEISEYELTAAMTLIDRDSSTSTETHFDPLITKCVQEIMKDQSRGGFAQKTILTDNLPGPLIPGQPECSRTLMFVITYRCKTKNPALAG